MTHSTSKPRILLLMTGGTISSRRDDTGATVATDRAETLLGQLRSAAISEHIAGIDVEARDVMLLGSYLMTPADMIDIVEAIAAALAADDIDGIVVSHGTDTMEETACLADLFHGDPRPVVFTGAQRSADVADTDGPRNLIDAITVAASPAARGLGVLISFAGRIFPAFGTRKTQTLDAAAFASGLGGSIGRVWDGSVVFDAAPRRPAPLDIAALSHRDVRVDIVPYYPGAATTALDAVAAAGAAGLVVAGTGAGNLDPEFCRSIAALTARGVLVALTTRVAHGPVTAIYGSGGGIDAVAAGAIPTGTVRASQARMLLVALLATGHTPGQARAEFARRCTPGTSAPGEAAGLDRRKEEMRG